VVSKASCYHRLGHGSHFIELFPSFPLIVNPSNRNRYVPNPSPSVFRTTKNNHNILQGVAPPELRLTQEAKDNFDAWILKNGLRWTAEGGPLARGGVDIVFIGVYPPLSIVFECWTIIC
jgi:hypothetical protein